MIDSLEGARHELARFYGPGVVVYALERTGSAFPCEVGYKTHDGRRVRLVAVGRGRTWAAAIENAERRITRERLGKPNRRRSSRRPLPQLEIDLPDGRP